MIYIKSLTSIGPLFSEEKMFGNVERLFQYTSTSLNEQS